MADLVMQFYRRNLPHLQRDFKPHFITFVTKTRCALPECARDITLSCCLHDHVHLILMPLINEQRREIFSLIDIMRGIKGASGRAINGCLGRHGPVWQEESFDHVLRWFRECGCEDRVHSAESRKKWLGDKLDGLSLGVGET